MTKHTSHNDFGDRERDLLAKLFRALGTDNTNEQNIARDKIDALLRKHDKRWTALPTLLGRGGPTISADLARRISALGSHNADQRQDARRWIDDLLIRRRRTWNDLAELLCSPTSRSWADEGDPRPPANFATKGFAVIDLVHRLLEYHVALKPHEYVAVTLWIMHAHVYDRFLVTPRLFLTSPVRGCGKTVLLSLLEALVPKPEKTDAISPAAIYHLVDRTHPTLLIDEVDNLGLFFAANGRLRSVFNSGHRKGGTVTLLSHGEPHKYLTFAPLALAAIGTVPLPLMHRSIVIPMERYDGHGDLRPFYGRDAATDYTYGSIRFWTREVTLNRDAEMPPQLHNRQADNWRPLLSIADAFGADWGARAREAAVEFTKSYQDEDAQVVLLRDIRTVFAARDVDRLFSASLVAALNAMDDAMWSEWRGLRGDQQPRHLSQGELAKLLSPFGIQPKTIWPLNRTDTTKSAKGYHREQFASAWRAYCRDDGPDGGTPSQTRNLRRLLGV